MTNITIVGRLTADPVCGETKNGVAYANFVIADVVTEGTVYFHTVVLFGKIADVARMYAKKGTQVAVAGSLAVREYVKNGEKRRITEIIGDAIKLLGSSEKQKQDITETSEQSEIDLPF